MLMKASTETLRRQNRALVLAALRRAGPLSHTDITEHTGLSSATVSAITGELEAENVLLRLEHAPASSRGRPRVLFNQDPSCAYIAAVRITADRIEYSLVDYAGTLKDRFELRRDGGAGVDAFSGVFRMGLARLVERSNLKAGQILTISITSKGLVDREAPVLLWSPVFDDAKVDFRALLSTDWPADVTLTNETRFAAQAVAEKRRSEFAEFTPRRFATLSLDHSIGLGIASRDADGNVTSFAPPFGHMVHSPDGPLCRCGSRGCIEAYAGFYGILRTAFEVGNDTIPANFIPLEEMEKIADRARSGDRMAGYAFRLAGEVIGIGLSRLHSFLGAMPVTVTGPGLHLLDLMQEGMERTIMNHLQRQFDPIPRLIIDDDEANLIFHGNVQHSLAELDTRVIAERRRIAGRAAS